MSLSRARLRRDPIEQFRAWYEAARSAGFAEPDAMALATADAAGRPAARMVLLKGFDSRGFVFATNFESRKGSHLAQNAQASLLFYWQRLHRQVRIEGRVVRTSKAESDEIFARRPRGAQLGCWASDQSREIADRRELERRAREAAARFPGAVSRPQHWGGFRVVPRRIEFWQGREHRLHDRFCYEARGRGRWVIRRLAP